MFTIESHCKALGFHRILLESPCFPVIFPGKSLINSESHWRVSILDASQFHLKNTGYQRVSLASHLVSKVPGSENHCVSDLKCKRTIEFLDSLASGSLSHHCIYPRPILIKESGNLFLYFGQKNASHTNIDKNP